MKLTGKAGQLVTAVTLALGLSVAASSAQAVIITETINFNNIPNGTVGPNQAVGTLLDFNYGPPPFGGPQRAFDIGGGNIVMVDDNPSDASGAAAGLVRIGGGNFSVLSMDIADLSNNPAGGGGSGGLSGSGSRIGYDPGNGTLPYPTSSTFQTVVLSGIAALQNTNAFFINIVSAGGGPSVDNFAIDNIVVQFDNGVPEPASLALLGLGLAGLGFSRHKKS